MLEDLCDHLLENPGLYLDEMVIFVRDEFRILAITLTVRRALNFMGWPKKTPSSRLGSKMETYEKSIFIVSQNLSYTTWSTLMSLVVINVSDLDE
jgi:hypothetical protein